VLAPYTGDNAVQGAISSAGCLSGIAPVNATGGVLGARLACKPFDTRGDPADAVPPLRTEYRKLGGRLAADVTLTPGQASYRSEVTQVIASHPDALISEMDPQSSTTFLSEYMQLSGGRLPVRAGDSADQLR
jgi:ABC-type branched-subunit amino acid transport system substrate-binding protein